MSLIHDEPAPYLKRVGENDLYAWEFAERPAIADRAETLTGTPTVTASEGAGLTIGSPSIVGTQVRVRLSAGTHGVDYLLLCTVATSGGSTLQQYGLLRVRT